MWRMGYILMNSSKLLKLWYNEHFQRDKLGFGHKSSFGFL